MRIDRYRQSNDKTCQDVPEDSNQGIGLKQPNRCRVHRHKVFCCAGSGGLGRHRRTGVIRVAKDSYVLNVCACVPGCVCVCLCVRVTLRVNPRAQTTESLPCA